MIDERMNGRMNESMNRSLVVTFLSWKQELLLLVVIKGKITHSYNNHNNIWVNHVKD